MRFDPDSYATVAERLAQFFDDHGANGPRVITEILEHDRETGFVLMKASLYTHFDDAEPAATGHAYELRSAGHVQAGNYIEVAETSAVGRALANLGYQTRKEQGSRAHGGARGPGRAGRGEGAANQSPPADGAAKDLRLRQAKAVVEAGGVELVQDKGGVTVWHVTEPGEGGKAVTRIVSKKSGDSFAACNCADYKQHAADGPASLPGYKCVHKLAVVEFCAAERKESK